MDELKTSWCSSHCWGPCSSDPSNLFVCLSSQLHVKRGDHVQAARLLVRAANNISKFPMRKCRFEVRTVHTWLSNRPCTSSVLCSVLLLLPSRSVGVYNSVLCSEFSLLGCWNCMHASSILHSFVCHVTGTLGHFLAEEFRCFFFIHERISSHFMSSLKCSSWVYR